MAKLRKKKTKNIKPFDEQNTKLAMGKAPSNKIKPTWPWRTRPKKDSYDLREIYDPVTGLGIKDFK